MLGKVNSLHGWYYWRAGIRNSIMLSLCFRSIAGTVLRPSSTHQEDDCKWLHAFSGKDQEKNEFMDWSFPLTRHPSPRVSSHATILSRPQAMAIVTQVGAIWHYCLIVTQNVFYLTNMLFLNQEWRSCRVRSLFAVSSGPVACILPSVPPLQCGERLSVADLMKEKRLW